MTSKRFSSLKEIEDIIEDEEFWSDLEEGPIDVVELPPDNVDKLSDCEDIDDDILIDTTTKDVPGQFEIHLPKSKRKRAKSLQSNWKKVDADFLQESFQSNNVDDIFKSMKENLKDKSPVQIFEELVSEDILEFIVTQSKLYASQENRHDFNLTPNCLKKFIGILLLSGYHSLPQEKLYWCEDEDINVQCVRNCITRNRFMAIKRNLHFNDNSLLSSMEKRDKIFKIRPLLDKMNVNFKKFGIFSKELAIDEQMVRYYGHHFLKQFIKGKPIRFGFKQWALCSSLTGYCFHMDLYEGKNDEIFFDSLGSSVVLSLASHLQHPQEHSLYFDNFFTSFNLMCKLNETGIKGTGTVRINRMNNCPIKNDTEMKKEKRGFYDYRFDKRNKILAITWNDNKCVKMLTNNLGIMPLDNVRRWSKSEKKEVYVDRPFILSQYNKFMGGVDKLDWNVQKYRIRFRGKKWYFPLFTNAIDVALYNAYVLYISANNPMPLLDFRRNIARAYLQQDSISNPKTSGRPPVIRSSRVTSEVRFDPIGHALERTNEGKQRKCSYCKRTVRKQCKKCNVGLHLECFPKWHSK